MTYWGTLIGGVLGALTRRPHFIVLGLAIGYAWDAGWLRRRKPAPPPAPSTNDAWEILGIEKGASWDEIEQAYRRRISEYHPDRLAGAAPELRDLAEQRAREINAAYESLRKQRKE